MSSRRAPYRRMAAFAEAFGPKRMLLMGGEGIAVDEFLARPATDWLAP